MKMRSLLVLFVAVGLVMNVMAQQKRVAVPDHLKNYSVTSSINMDRDHAPGQMSENPYVSNPNKSFTETIIGNTEYDVQTNKCIDTRIYLYPDNTIGAAWIRGTGGFTDRGTGYNYYDGTSWGAHPTARIENVRTGWGSYAPFNDGEIVIAHEGATNFVMSTRPTKGTGAWTTTLVPGPTGAEVTWPRVTTVGDTIHILSASYVTYENMENPIIYSRSLDAGVNWTHTIIPGMDFASGELSYSADMYAWAHPKNGVLAFVVGNMWQDVYLMKSTDGGDTWTKSIIFDHPNPFTFDTGTPMDTTYVCDGLLAAEIDNSGEVHVAFGATRVLVEDPASEQFSWFPFVSYLAYWNESMGVLTDLTIDVMDAQGRAIGYLLDLDNDGTLFADFTDFAQIVSYGNHGMVSQPQLSIDSNDDLYVTFAHVNETNYSGVAYYRHIWARKSTDGGATWSDFSEITGGLVHEYDECVYGAMAKNTDNYIHMIYQLDDQPGTGTGTAPDHSQGNNDIIYIRVLKTDIGTTSANISEYNTINAFSVYPNPATDVANVEIVSPVMTTATINVTNIMGQLIFTQAVDVTAGSNTVTLGLENVQAGVYFVSVEAQNFNQSQKLIVQ